MHDEHAADPLTLLYRISMRTLRVVALSSCVCLIGALVYGCSSDDPVATSPGATPEAGTQPGTDGATTIPPPVGYTVPAGGGAVDVPTASGKMLTFEFPPSAAGKAIVLSATDAASIGWTAGDLSDVIKMEPDGTQFADPVLVHSSTGGVLLATFPTSATKTAPEWLALAADGKSSLLHHFSTLAVVNASCAYTNDVASSKCTNGATHLDLACDLPQLCSHVAVGCCAAPGAVANGCRFGSDALSFDTSAISSASSYCAAVDGGSVTDAATDAPTDASPVATADAGTNGNCSLPQFMANDAGAGNCTLTRTDGTAAIKMICTPSACHCYVNNTSAPYGADFGSGSANCGAPQLAQQQMVVNCGCP